MSSWLFFLLLSFSCVLLEGFFSMFEMACVSFNKVRLQYYISKKKRRAIWLNNLLNNPSRLFGTTLISVNTVLQIGSEASRRFYESVGLSPDIAPFTQVIIVLIFGELAPLFAARKHAEQVALGGVGIIYLFSKILTPFIWFIKGISYITNRLFNVTKSAYFYLSRDEVQRAFEEREPGLSGQEENIDSIISQIFSLRQKKASHIKMSIESVKTIPSNTTISEMKNILSVNYSPFIPIYHHFTHNIVAITTPRDLIGIDAKSRVIDHSNSPWFITEDSSVIDILKQFRSNNQSVAVVLDSEGKATGFLTLDQIIDEIFEDIATLEAQKVVVEKKVSGDMPVSEFNRSFHSNIACDEDQTISELICQVLEHHPAKGEVIRIDQFEFIVDEPSLLGAKTILVRTLY